MQSFLGLFIDLLSGVPAAVSHFLLSLAGMPFSVSTSTSTSNPQWWHCRSQSERRRRKRPRVGSGRLCQPAASGRSLSHRQTAFVLIKRNYSPASILHQSDCRMTEAPCDWLISSCWPLTHTEARSVPPVRIIRPPAPPQVWCQQLMSAGILWLHGLQVAAAEPRLSPRVNLSVWTTQWGRGAGRLVCVFIFSYSLSLGVFVFGAEQSVCPVFQLLGFYGCSDSSVNFPFQLSRHVGKSWPLTPKPSVSALSLSPHVSALCFPQPHTPTCFLHLQPYWILL